MEVCEATDSVLCCHHTMTGLKSLLKLELGMRVNKEGLSRNKVRKVWQLIQQKGSFKSPVFG